MSNRCRSRDVEDDGDEDRCEQQQASRVKRVRNDAWTQQQAVANSLDATAIQMQLRAHHVVPSRSSHARPTELLAVDTSNVVSGLSGGTWLEPEVLPRHITVRKAASAGTQTQPQPQRVAPLSVAKAQPQTAAGWGTAEVSKSHYVVNHEEEAAVQMETEPETEVAEIVEAKVDEPQPESDIITPDAKETNTDTFIETTTTTNTFMETTTDDELMELTGDLQLDALLGDLFDLTDSVPLAHVPSPDHPPRNVVTVDGNPDDANIALWARAVLPNASPATVCQFTPCTLEVPIAIADLANNGRFFCTRDVLGRGCLGVVYKGVDRVTGAGVACKVMGVRTEAEMAQVLHEAITMVGVQSDSVLKLRLLEGSLNCAKLHLELAELGSLLDLARQHQGLNPDLVRMFTRQLVSALNDLHCRGVVHADIKCGNVLLSEPGKIKLCDFGSAVHRWGCHYCAPDANAFHGSILWAPPEAMRTTSVDFPRDIWSLGCTVIEMVQGFEPWGLELAGYEPQAAMYYIVTKPEVPKVCAGNVSPACQEFLSECLQRDPALRPTVGSLMNHQWCGA